jgi:hypothetical protein
MRTLIVGLTAAALAFGPAFRAAAESKEERAVAQQIAQNMKNSGKLKDYRVGVKYQDGVAWLMGTVTSPQQKKLAESIARKSEGVQSVVSKLEVSGTGDAQADLPPAKPQIRALDSLSNLPKLPDAMPESSEEVVQPASLNLALSTAGQAQKSQQMSKSRPARQLSKPRRNGNMPVPYARTMQAPIEQAGYGQYAGPAAGGMAPMPMSNVPTTGVQNVRYDNPKMPGYAWPSYAAYPNYAGVSYPQQYSPTAWPYIGPFYPYPQVPLGWRKVTLEWDDGWWMLDFKDCKDCH